MDRVDDSESVGYNLGTVGSGKKAAQVCPVHLLVLGPFSGIIYIISSKMKLIVVATEDARYNYSVVATELLTSRY